MSGRQRWTKQYVQPCSPFLAIVRKGHYPPSEVWADRCLSLSTAHRTVSKVLWRCAKIYRRIQNDTQLDWTSLRLRWTWIPWEVKSRVDLGFYGGSARKGWTVGHSPRKQRLQQGEGKGKNVQEMHSVTTCYNFTSQKCNRNGNATLSLSLSLSMSMYQCCLSHRWLALGWGTGPGLIAHGTQRNFEEIASLLVTFVTFVTCFIHECPVLSCHLLDLGHPWTA